MHIVAKQLSKDAWPGNVDRNGRSVGRFKFYVVVNSSDHLVVYIVDLLL